MSSTASADPVRIAISMGDANGIGPEVIIKGLCSDAVDLTASIPVILGQEHVLEYYQELMAKYLTISKITNSDKTQPGHIYLMQVGEEEIEVCPGHLRADSGKLSMQSVDAGIQQCISNFTDALVTAPINKEAIHLAGYRIPGHTEYLAEKTGCSYPVMMMLSKLFNIALVTTHIPLKQVSRQITTNDVSRSALILNDTLKKYLGVPNPHIAVLGLNPHAGDGGVLGSEENQCIIPAMNRLREQGVHLDGPFPADGFFARQSYRYYDAVLAMYHDQGLIPFKLLSSDKGVNYTAGLPIIRTSPDHGTAYAISGLGQADESSFVEAYNKAVLLAKNRKASKA